MKFIAVSKKCCYLCELFIEFAQRNGYNVKILGKNNKKLYWNWKLPNIYNNVNFMNKFLLYIMRQLDIIIENKIDYQLDKTANDYFYKIHLDFLNDLDHLDDLKF